MNSSATSTSLTGPAVTSEYKDIKTSSSASSAESAKLRTCTVFFLVIMYFLMYGAKKFFYFFLFFVSELMFVDDYRARYQGRNCWNNYEHRGKN